MPYNTYQIEKFLNFKLNSDPIREEEGFAEFERDEVTILSEDEHEEVINEMNKH